MERTVKLKDAEGNIFEIDITIEGGKFSMSGNWGGGCGQCLDHIKPKNKEQKKLVNLWHKWHLNDMNAGTEEQEAYIKEHLKSNYDYDKACQLLKDANLYEVIHEGKKYKYGHGWITRKLPANIEEETIELCDKIEEIEKEEKGEILVSDALNMTEEKLEKLEFNENDFSDEIFALATHLELTIDELEDIEEDGNNTLIHGGIYYYVGTYDDLYDKALEYMKDGELWKMAVESGNTELGLEEWAEMVVNGDGIGHTLNGWDGSEYEEEINGTNYIICRQ
jgi:hypothetical protein